MEILKRGVIPGEETADWTCLDCNSEIRSKKNEGSLWQGFNKRWYVLTPCPVCESQGHVPLDCFD